MGGEFTHRGTPKPIARAKNHAGRQGQRAAARSQKPLLPQRPLLRHYTPAQRAVLNRDYRHAASHAIRSGVPATAVHDYLRDTHSRRTLAPYFAAGRQEVRERKQIFGSRYGQVRPRRKQSLPGKVEQATLGAFNDRLTRQLQSVGPGALALAVPTNVAQATYEDPLHVAPRTLVGGAQMVAAAPAGVVAALMHPKKVPGQVKADYQRRYADLLAGRPEAFRQRIKEEGAAPELADIVTVAAVGGATTGRAATALARSVGRARVAFGQEPGRVVEALTGERPGLRVSGGTVRPQELSPNAFKAVAQRVQDAARRRTLARRNTKAVSRSSAEKPVRVAGVQPQTAREVVALTRRGQNRLQRVEAARLQSRAFGAMKHEQAIEIHRGAAKNIRKLSPKQREAVVYALEGGIPLDKGTDAAVKALERHRAMVVREHTRSGRAGKPPEIDRIDYLIKHADEIFGKRGLAEFHARELERGKRIAQGDPSFKDLTGEVRRRRPQAELLDVKHGYDETLKTLTAARDRQLRTAKDANERDLIHTQYDKLLERLDDAKPELDREFIVRVDAAARDAGLPEPVYVHHYPTTKELPGNAGFAIGGSRAAAAPKPWEGTLFRQGRRDARHVAYEQGLAESIKRKHNWRLVAAQAKAHSLPNPTHDEIRLVLGHQVPVDKLSAYEWKQILQHRGIDSADVALWNPGRQEIALAREIDPALARARGWRAAPRAAVEEVNTSRTPSGLAGRSLDKAMGLQSAVLLGTSPAWMQAQVAANAFITGFAIKGRVTDLVKAPLWYRRLPDDLKQAADEVFGTGAGESHGRSVHLGVTANNRVVNAWRMFKQTDAMRRLGRVNPIKAMFAVDNVQNRYFKRVVLYNSAKRAAFKDMSKNGGLVASSLDRLNGVLTLGPKQRIEAILRDPQVFERHAQHVNDFLGDYVTYTAAERRSLKRFVLFYGFFRYALRTLFYTVPVKHPIMGAIVGKLAQLHVDEVKDLLGGDDAPWAYSRLYFGKGDELRSIDLARINPVSNPLVETVQGGPKALASPFLSPALQSALNQAYGRNLFQQRGFRVGGSAEEIDNPNLGERGRIVANDLLSTLAPYRIAKDATQTGTQGDDSLLFSPRPLRYKTAEARARDVQRRGVEQGPGATVLQGLEPFLPKPDSTRAFVQRQHRAGGGVSGGSDVDKLRDALRHEKASPGTDIKALREALRKGG